MKEETKQKKKRPIALFIILGLIYLISVALIILVYWSTEEYSFTLTEILYTLTSPLKGANSAVSNDIIYKCIPAILLLLIPYIILVILDCLLFDKLTIQIKKGDTCKTLQLGYILRKLSRILLILLFVFSLCYASVKYNLIDFIKYKLQSTKIYEEEYVTPTDSVLTHYYN